MPTLKLSFPPPRNWQDFEQLTKDVAKFRLAGDFENYGRQGQAQNGIDIFGQNKNNHNVGLQCKHKGHTPTTAKEIVTLITKKTIDDEVKLADSFSPALNHFIIATTTFRDVSLQNHINNLNFQRIGGNLPKIEIWFWELFEETINRHSELSYAYFEEILKNHHQYNKDTHILELLKQSFTRPAFNTTFHSENNCEDFLKAISDTQRAFSTGQLYDREGNLLYSAYPANSISLEDDRNEIEKIERLLQKTRDFTTENLKNGNIVQELSFLYFPNDHETKVSETLNDYRVRVVDILNNILQRHKLKELQSMLH